MKKTCHIKYCRMEPKFKVAAELVNLRSDIKMCQVHLLVHLRGTSQAIEDTVGKALTRIVNE